jgi:hypothetical protein
LHVTKLYIAEVPSSNKVENPPWKVWAEVGGVTYSVSKPFNSVKEAKKELIAIASGKLTIRG